MRLVVTSYELKYCSILAGKSDGAHECIHTKGCVAVTWWSFTEPKHNVSRLLTGIMHSNEAQFPKPNEKSLYVTAL